MNDDGPRCSVCGFRLLHETNRCELRCHERPSHCACGARLSNEFRMNGITVCLECLERGAPEIEEQAQ